LKLQKVNKDFEQNIIEMPHTVLAFLGGERAVISSDPISSFTLFLKFFYTGKYCDKLVGNAC
jgi:hypothetical protein